MLADFVTPLKKRRLARESLSVESVASESPTPGPSSSQSGGSYFVNLMESGEPKLESFKNKNGFKSFFSPLRPDSIEEDAMVCKVFNFVIASILLENRKLSFI